MPITTFGIGAAVTPTVVKTTISHYTNRKPRAKKPTAHISYDQGLHLIRSFLDYASHHTVEEVQAFTAQWVPHPSWVRLENINIPETSISKAAGLLIEELGEQGVQEIGGKKWWQWRKKDAPLRAEWIEMRADYNRRQKSGEKCRRIMMYIHGGAYFFGSVDEHRYQMQRHARKLNARVFAPRYRLAPQFPFPCGLLDCLSAYLYLLTIHEPSEIILAGDSAGAGMILSLLCLLRDQDIALPAGGILISPWVDLTHSFPSLSRNDGFDYIPPHGFMQKPSRSWPPPNEDEILEILQAAGVEQKTDTARSPSSIGASSNDGLAALDNVFRKTQAPLSLQLDGKEVIIKDQIQLYTTNQLITHPLVSPILQPSLGGLPPLLIMVGDGELLRDEQIYVAHKAADPHEYKLNDLWRSRYDPEDKILKKYKPTPVQLQAWEDLCHVAPTLSFTRPAKYMYRSIAQFGAWALSRAQKRAIEIMTDDNSSVNTDASDDESDDPKTQSFSRASPTPNGLHAQIGKAGDPIPPFRNSMIREQVDRHGIIYPLPLATELPAMKMDSNLIGVVKEGPIREWLAAKRKWDTRYAVKKRRVMKQRVNYYKAGHRLFFGEDENPPSCALAARQQDEEALKPTRTKKSWGLGVWSSWGWKHDERTIQKDEELTHEEEKAERKAEKVSSKNAESPVVTIDGTVQSDQDQNQNLSQTRSRSRRRTVTVHDQGQIEGEHPESPSTTFQNFPPVVVEPAIDPNAAVPEPDHLSPMFLPKWKTASHLRDETKDISDTGSTYSRRTIPDNASTMAVFSAPGVTTKPDPESTDDQPPDAAATDSLSFDRNTNADHPYAAAPRDHVGGYDTPVSRRSVERLQSNQIPVGATTDGMSMHSSIPTIAARDRVQPLRSPSAVAVVQAEGVIAPVNDDDDADDKNNNHNNAEEDLAKGEDTKDVGQERPGLYNRDNSNFVTAKERL